jgi:hypothetical protein
VSAAEFEQMKRDLEVEPQAPSRQTSTITKRRAKAPEAPQPSPEPKPQPPAGSKADDAPADSGNADTGGNGAPERAPDIAENEGVAPVQRPKSSGKSRPRNRRHGRRR